MYNEYPKMLFHPTNGTHTIVHSESEESAHPHYQQKPPSQPTAKSVDDYERELAEHKRLVLVLDELINESVDKESPRALTELIEQLRDMKEAHAAGEAAREVIKTAKKGR